MKKVLFIILCLALMFSVLPCQAFSTNYDVDGDGRVSINDVTEIQKWLAEYDRPKEQLICLDDVSPYVPKELEFIPTLLSEEVGKGEGYVIVDSSVLTAEILEHRTEQDVLVVERIIGVATNNNGEGRVLNTNGDFTRISYKYINEPTKTGTVVLTYYIYNPNNNFIDDIVNRYDFVIDRSFEE